MTTVTWTQDVNGNYEVSSPQHLKQIMHEGSLYTDAGSAPTGYYAAGTSYIQTADIDLLNDTTDIKPFGDATVQFYSNYDGRNYSISNYSYLDPNFTSTDKCATLVGVFGFTTSNVLKNIRLSGIFTIQGFNDFCGFLTGYAYKSDIYNIVCDFDVGTTITCGDTTTASATVYVGCISGGIRGTVKGFDIKGTVNFVLDGNVGVSIVGGFCGMMSIGNASLVRLAATFPSGLSGTHCAGIVGRLSSSTISDCINNMTGDITGASMSGGIVCYGDGTHSITNVVNSMTGNIIGNTYAGGITGRSLSTGTYNALFNYMTGDISGPNSGGIVGQASDTSIVKILLTP